MTKRVQPQSDTVVPLMAAGLLYVGGSFLAFIVFGRGQPTYFVVSILATVAVLGLGIRVSAVALYAFVVLCALGALSQLPPWPIQGRLPILVVDSLAVAITVVHLLRQARRRHANHATSAAGYEQGKAS